MKKILLLLFFIATNMRITQLNAYCMHNYSKNKKFRIVIFNKKPKWSSYRKLDTGKSKAEYHIKPEKKKCRNWKSIGGERTKLWWWVILSDEKRHIQTPQAVPIVYRKTIASGQFPIGGAIVFYGYDANNRPKISIHFGPDPTGMPEWQYKKKPWSLSKQPWQNF